MSAAYVVRRVLLFFVVVWAATTFIFFLPKMAPGRNPVLERIGMMVATGGVNTGGLQQMVEAYQKIEWRAEELKAAPEAIGMQRGLKLGKAQAPVRVAVTGRTVGLPLFESLEIVGRDRTVARLRAALDRLS